MDGTNAVIFSSEKISRETKRGKITMKLNDVEEHASIKFGKSEGTLSEYRYSLFEENEARNNYDEIK